jgi:hypothetical protein
VLEATGQPPTFAAAGGRSPKPSLV